MGEPRVAPSFIKEEKMEYVKDKVTVYRVVLSQEEVDLIHAGLGALVGNDAWKLYNEFEEICSD